PVDDLDRVAAAHWPPEHTVGAALYAHRPVRVVRYQRADPPRVVVEAQADGHANTPAPARTRLRVNALSKEISDRTTRTTSPPISMWFSMITEPRSVGSTVSPARARIGTSAPGGPGTTPPLWNFGSFGAPTVFPPIPGTQSGTVHCSCPTVLFHASAMKLNAARNGAVMKSLTLLKKDFSLPGTCLNPSITPFHLPMIHSATPAMPLRI